MIIYECSPIFEDFSVRISNEEKQAQLENAISLLVESIDMDVVIGEKFGIMNEGALDTIKEKVRGFFTKLKEFFDGIVEKLKNFLGKVQDKKTEENIDKGLEKLKDKKSAKNESTILEDSAEDQAKEDARDKRNERIYHILYTRTLIAPEDSFIKRSRDCIIDDMKTLNRANTLELDYEKYTFKSLMYSVYGDREKDSDEDLSTKFIEEWAISKPFGIAGTKKYLDDSDLESLLKKMKEDNKKFTDCIEEATKVYKDISEKCGQVSRTWEIKYGDENDDKSTGAKILLNVLKDLRYGQMLISKYISCLIQTKNAVTEMAMIAATA